MEKQNDRIKLVGDVKSGKICVYEVKDGKYVQTLSTGIYRQQAPDITELLYASRELFLEAVAKLKAVGFKKASIYRYHANASYLNGFKLFKVTEKELVYVL